MISGLVAFDTLHLQELVVNGFRMIRIDLQRETPPRIQQVIDEILDWPDLRPLIIVREVDSIDAVEEGLDIELGNEPDLEHEGWTPESYLTRCTEFIERSRGRHRLWFGAVSNLNDRGFTFLRHLPWKEWGPEISCSVHRYPEPSGPVDGHDRRTRDEEIEELVAIVGARALGLSEVGYASEWTETEQAAHYAWERTFFALHGFEYGVAYQINSSDEDPYGFRRADGTWKPCTQAWTR